MIAGRLLIGLLLTAGGSLSACSKNSEGDTLTVASSEADTGRPEDRFGKGFGKKFRADPNSEPAEVADGDVVPVSETTEPVLID